MRGFSLPPFFEDFFGSATGVGAVAVAFFEIGLADFPDFAEVAAASGFLAGLPAAGLDETV